MSRVLDKNHQLLFKTLSKYAICKHIAGTPISSCRFGQQRALIFNTALPTTTYPAGWLTQDKFLQKLWLIDRGIQTPNGISINCNNLSTLNSKTLPFSFPVVLKPIVGQYGDFVYLEIESKAELLDRIKKTFLPRKINRILIEEQVSGLHLRIYVDSSGTTRVGRFLPPSVIGDGKHSILALIQIENYKRLSNKHKQNATIKISEMLLCYLAKLSLSLDFIPALKQPIQLNSVINRGMGGVYTDLTGKVHPSLITNAKNILKIFPGLSAASVEFICENYSTSLESQKHWVTEVSTDLGLFLYNRKPAYQNHQQPHETIASSLLMHN